MENLIKMYEEANALVKSLYEQICEANDGYTYLINVRSFGDNSWRYYHNQYVVNEVCGHYNGDNGIVDVYTNNKDHNIDNYSGDTYISTIDQMKSQYSED